MRRTRLLLLLAVMLFSNPLFAEPPRPPQTNSEMTNIFDADQAARQLPPDKIDWSIVGPQDNARRSRTKQLLDAGVLHTADDFYHAAFVFQHGDQPNDYLLAHILAMASVKLGRPDASWIAAATLDRYLQTIGQKQVFGTQFRKMDSQPWSMDPYDKQLLSDALRQAVGVHTLTEQEDKLRELNGSSKP